MGEGGAVEREEGSTVGDAAWMVCSAEMGYVHGVYTIRALSIAIKSLMIHDSVSPSTRPHNKSRAHDVVGDTRDFSKRFNFMLNRINFASESSVINISMMKIWEIIGTSN